MWLTQSQMTELFGVDRTSIVRHIRNIYKSEELDQNSTCAKNAQVRTEGHRRIFVQVARSSLRMYKTAKASTTIPTTKIWLMLPLTFSLAVIFICSANSNVSINVIREVGYAVTMNKPILLLFFDDAPYAKSIRLDISDIDQIDFRNLAMSSKNLIMSLMFVVNKWGTSLKDDAI